MFEKICDGSSGRRCKTNLRSRRFYNAPSCAHIAQACSKVAETIAFHADEIAFPGPRSPQHGAVEKTIRKDKYAPDSRRRLAPET